MSRSKISFRSASKDNYISFCIQHTEISISYNEWKNVIYGYIELFKEHILTTGEKLKLPRGIGEFTINKKIRKKKTGVNNEFINLPIDWQKTKEKGKRIYNFNYHTEGYYFGWIWFRSTARFTKSDIWYFKACRNTSRLLAHYIKNDALAQHNYIEHINYK
jgi:hypothetical protein